MSSVAAFAEAGRWASVSLHSHVICRLHAYSYLNRKKLKKKGKLGKDEPTTLEKIMQDKAKVRFGEQADAPLEINLKRKHWWVKMQGNAEF